MPAPERLAPGIRQATAVGPSSEGDDGVGATEAAAVLDRVRELVVAALELPIEPRDIDPDEPLFGGDATVDSIGSLEIVAALEAAFGLSIPDEDLRVELFDSVRSLAEYVLSRTAAAAPVSTRPEEVHGWDPPRWPR